MAKLLMAKGHTRVRSLQDGLNALGPRPAIAFNRCRRLPTYRREVPCRRRRRLRRRSAKTPTRVHELGRVAVPARSDRECASAPLHQCRRSAHARGNVRARTLRFRGNHDRARYAGSSGGPRFRSRSRGTRTTTPRFLRLPGRCSAWIATSANSIERRSAFHDLPLSSSACEV